MACGEGEDEGEGEGEGDGESDEHTCAGKRAPACMRLRTTLVKCMKEFSRSAAAVSAPQRSFNNNSRIFQRI